MVMQGEWLKERGVEGKKCITEALLTYYFCLVAQIRNQIFQYCLKVQLSSRHGVLGWSWLSGYVDYFHGPS